MEQHDRLTSPGATRHASGSGVAGFDIAPLGGVQESPPVLTAHPAQHPLEVAQLGGVEQSVVHSRGLAAKSCADHRVGGGHLGLDGLVFESAAHMLDVRAFTKAAQRLRLRSLRRLGRDLADPLRVPTGQGRRSDGG